MTIDETIKKYEAEIEDLKESCKDPNIRKQGLYGMQILRCKKEDIEEYSQLIKWLKELKEFKGE